MGQFFEPWAAPDEFEFRRINDHNTCLNVSWSFLFYGDFLHMFLWLFLSTSMIRAQQRKCNKRSSISAKKEPSSLTVISEKILRIHQTNCSFDDVGMIIKRKKEACFITSLEMMHKNSAKFFLFCKKTA